jgi:type IV pilus assembly protein PilQ
VIRAIAACLALVTIVSGTAVAQSLISMDVHDVDISDVIALLASESGANIITDGSVKPERVTVHLRDVTFDDALDAIVNAHGLEVHRRGAVLIVGSAETMNRRGDTVMLPLQHAVADDVAKEMSDALPEGTVVIADKRSGSVVVAGDAETIARARQLVAILDTDRVSDGAGAQTRSYQLRFLRPDDVVAKLKTVLSEGTFLTVEEQNAVLVTGSEHVQSAAANVIASIDQPSPQILFEVKVADLTPINDQTNVGLQFGGLDLLGQPLAGGTTWAFTSGTIPVNVQLNALISKGRASILATPKLVTLNNKEANLMIGETYPIVYSTSVFGGQNVQYVDIGVHLRLTPTIGTDGSVTAELHPEYSELIGYTSTGYPIVANRKIDSTLRVKDNQTIVLGGLIRDASNETIQKVPGLSAIPIIGKLFENKQTDHERDEIVFLITPHVIYPNTPPPVK